MSEAQITAAVEALRDYRGPDKMRYEAVAELDDEIADAAIERYNECFAYPGSGLQPVKVPVPKADGSDSVEPPADANISTPLPESVKSAEVSSSSETSDDPKDDGTSLSENSEAEETSASQSSGALQNS
jgi:hypothetical protein